MQAGLVLAPVYFLTELSPCLCACPLRRREMTSTSTPRKMDESYPGLDREGNPLGTLRRRVLSLAVFSDRRKEKRRLRRGRNEARGLQHPCGACGNGCFKCTENKSIWPELCITRNIMAATGDRCLEAVSLGTAAVTGSEMRWPAPRSEAKETGPDHTLSHQQGEIHIDT